MKIRLIMLALLFVAVPGYAAVTILDRDGIQQVLLSPSGAYTAILNRAGDVAGAREVLTSAQWDAMQAEDRRRAARLSLALANVAEDPMRAAEHASEALAAAARRRRTGAAGLQLLAPRVDAPLRLAPAPIAPHGPYGRGFSPLTPF